MSVRTQPDQAGQRTALLSESGGRSWETEQRSESTKSIQQRRAESRPIKGYSNSEEARDLLHPRAKEVHVARKEAETTLEETAKLCKRC